MDEEATQLVIKHFPSLDRRQHCHLEDFHIHIRIHIHIHIHIHTDQYQCYIELSARY
jgi:hypothetical protein